MTERIKRAWEHFERALPALGRPDVSLAPPATEADLVALEATVGEELPPEVRAFWSVHDGELPRNAGLAAGFCFVSVEEARKVLADWASTRVKLGADLKSLDRESRSHPPNAIQRKYSLPGWIPILRDHEGNYVGIDLAPGPAGHCGQVINFGRDEEEKYVFFPSVVELLEWLGGELEAGRIVYDAEDGIVLHTRGRLVSALPAPQE